MFKQNVASCWKFLYFKTLHPAGAVRLGLVVFVALASLAMAVSGGAVPSKANPINVEILGFTTATNPTTCAPGIWNISAIDHDGGLSLRFDLDWGDSSPLQSITHTNPGLVQVHTITPTHQYTTAGPYTINLTVYDMAELSEHVSSSLAVNVSTCGGTLVIKKHVINDNGGTKQAADFSLNVTATNPSSATVVGAESGVTITVDPGTYSVDEPATTGYTKTLGSDCSGTIAAGETKTCLVTNDDVPPPPPPQCVLTITKSVSAATANPGDTLTYTLNFKNTGTANCTGGGVEVQDVLATQLTFVAATHSSNVTPGYNGILLYTSGTRTLTWNANVLTPNQTGTVSWTATVKTPTACGAFDIPNTGHITSAEYNNGTTWIDSNTVHTTGSTVCVGQLATLVVKKHVDNSGGGTKQAADFTLHVKAGSADITNSPAAGSETGTTYTVPAGTYQVSEDAPTGGYTNQGLSGDCAVSGSVTLSAGDTKVCTITNASPVVPGTLVVKKHVINNNTGTKTAADFTLHVKSALVDVTGSPAQGSETGVSYTLAPGAYVVSEDAVPSGYTLSEDTLPANYTQTGLTGDCSVNGTVTVVSGATSTCTITNSDQTPPPSTATLLVVKHVVNTHTGVKSAADFNLHVQAGVADVTHSPAQGSETGVSYTLAPGSYTVSEDAVPTGYTQTSIAGDCSSSGSVTLAAGDSKTCTITNSDLPPSPTTATLIVVKHVINDNGGIKQAADFTMNVTATNVSPQASFPGSEIGTTVTLAAGTYSVDEVATSGYDKVLDSACAGTIAAGETKTCLITNNDQPPVVTTGCTSNCGGGGGGGGGGSPPPDCSVPGNRVEPTTVDMSIPPGGVAGSTAALKLTYGSDVTGVVLSNSDSFSPQSSVPLAPVISWSLAPGSGSKTVYARFFNKLGCSATKNVVTEATITTPPTPRVLGAACINLTAEALKVKSPAMSVARQFSGQLLLQCQPGSTIAWYVDPSTNERFYLPPEDATYDVLKVFASPISNADLAKISLGLTTVPNPTPALPSTALDQSFAQAQGGKLFVQKEATGELWYVNPVDSKRYFIPATVEASEVVEAVGQCTKDDTLDRITIGLQAHGISLSKVSSCYPPSPKVLGASTSLPRTGFPTDILLGLPLLSIMAVGFTEIGRDWVRG